MRVGLIDIEPKVVNTALMQIASYHKQRGDTVEWAMPLTYSRYDCLYCSSIFDYTDKNELPERTICGGTGFDLTTQLPSEVAECDYDYTIYPQCNFSIVWFSRGCIRNCPFCVVRQKEGYIRPAVPSPLNNKGKYIVVQDNNFFANPEWRKAIRWLTETGKPIVLQGVDVRLLNREMLQALNSLHHHRQIKIAWDNPRDDITPQLELMLRYIKPYKIMCYVLIGYWSDEAEDLMRVRTLYKYGIDPFAMPYKKSDPYQKAFTRWVNHKAIFKSVQWQDYKKPQVI